MARQMVKKDLEVYCLKYAETEITEAMVIDKGDNQRKIPICFAIYLIKTEDKKILVDAGCDTMPSFNMKKFFSPAFVLRQVGLTAADITDVIVTHAHHDHIAALTHFEKATLHITIDEYEQGKKYIPSGMKTNCFKTEYSVSPNIKIIRWGGHNEGSAIVQIKNGGITHILAGDECYTDYNIKAKKHTGAYFDKKAAQKFIDTFVNSGYKVYTCHDSSLKTERII